MIKSTFQERVCHHLNVPADQYAAAMLRRTLYGHARGLRWLTARGWLAPDRHFIANLGRVTHRRGLDEELAAFRSDPRNRTFARRTLRLRISGARVVALIGEVWPTGVAPHAARKSK